MARPTKLTPEIQQKICDALAAGNYYEAACQFAGIEYGTFRRWMKRGERSRNDDDEFKKFCNAVRKAEADAEVGAVALWRAQMPENWQAARDFLARRFPDRWMPKERREHTGEGGSPIQVEDVTDLSDEERAAGIAAILDRARERAARRTTPPG